MKYDVEERERERGRKEKKKKNKFDTIAQRFFFRKLVAYLGLSASPSLPPIQENH